MFIMNKGFNIVCTIRLDQLAVLNLKSLEMRRLKLDLRICHKIIHNSVVLPVDSYFNFVNIQLNTGNYDPNNLLKPLRRAKLSE